MAEEERLLGEAEGRAEEGLFMVTERLQPASLARAVRGDGQCRVAQGEAHGTCVPGKLGLEQSRSCSLPAENPECFLPCRRKGSGAAQSGSSLPEPELWGAGLAPCWPGVQ